MKILSKVIIILCSIMFCSNLLKAQYPAIALSADPVVFGGSWIAVKISIPESSVSNSPVTVTLVYRGGDRFLDNPPQSILIPANKREIAFDIDVEDIPDRDQLLNISAQAIGFAGSNSLSVTLVRDIKPASSAMILSSIPRVLGGGSVLVTVRVPEINKSNMPITVELSYGDGESWLKNPPASVLIQPGKDEAEFTINVKDDFASSEEILVISAKAAWYSEYANSLKIKLLPAVIKSPKEGLLTLPPLPELKIQKGKVTPNLSQETISRSYNALNGFWIACEFKYKEEYIFAIRDERWLNVSGIYYFWIPLGQLSGYNHNLYYYGRASYNLVDSELSNYGKQKQVQGIDLKRGYRLSLIPDLVYKQNTESGNLNSFSSFPNSFLQQVGLASIDYFSSSYARYPSEDVTNSFGFHLNNMDENIAALTKNLNENTRPATSSGRLIKGDKPGHKKAYAHFVPRVFYELGNAHGPLERVDLEQYIKYDDVEAYIQKIFQNEQSFNEYLDNFEEVQRVNKDGFPLSKYGGRLYHSDYLMAIRNYCIALFDGSTVYGNSDKYRVEVNIPTFKQKEAVLELYKPGNKSSSSGYKSWKSDLSQAAVTLTASRTTLKAGGSATTVTLSYVPGSPGIDKVKIKLLYEGIGAEFIEGPKTVLVDVKDVSARIKGIPTTSFVIKTTADYKLSDSKTIKIMAQALDAEKKLKTISSITFTLQGNQYDIKQVAHAEFEFPPTPKLKIENDFVTLDAFNKTTSWGKNSPDGFFVQCKLKAKFTGTANFNRGITEDKYLSIDKSNPNKPIYLWIPLKKNNPLKYRITAYYKLGNSELLYYGQSNNQHDSYTKMTGSQSSTSKFDEQFREDYTENSDQKESTQTHSVTLLDDIATGNSYLKGQGANIEHVLSLPSQGINFSTSFWTNSSQNNYKNHTNSTNTFNGTTARNLLETKIGYKLGSRNSTSFTDQVSTNLSAQHAVNKSQLGPPIPYFVKASAFIQPVLTYSLVDPSKGTLENITDYIDYESLSCLEAKPKTLKEYIQYIMEPDQFNEAEDLSNTPLACYLRTFPQVNVMNKELESLTKTISDYIYSRYAYRTKYLEEIQVDSYSINITDFNAPYSAIFVHKSIPINCGAVNNLSHQFTSEQGKDAISTFQWDAAPSSTQFQLEIRDNKGKLIAEHVLDRECDPISKEPNKPQLFDRRTSYSVSVPYYTARVKSKCGADGEWSAYSGPITFTRDRSVCKVRGIQATYTSGNGYHITWDPLDGIVGYKLEYANEDEPYRAACKDLASWRNDPCDETLTNNEYFHTSTKNFNIKVTPVCPVGKGLSTVANFKLHDLVPCTAITNSITVTFDENDSRPVFEWELPLDGVASLIETKERSAKWRRKIRSYVQNRGNRAEDGEFLQEEEVSAYTPGKTYVVRISSQCILDTSPSSKNWTKPSPEVVFTIPIIKNEGEKLNAFLGEEVSSSLTEKNQGSNPSPSSILPDLEPDLLIAPNPVIDWVTFSIVNLSEPAGEVIIKLYGIYSNQELYFERQTNIEEGKKMILNKDLLAGTYILTVLLDGKRTLKKQFIRE